MGYSVHVPLVFGHLKFKSEGRLRWRELEGAVPVHRLGSVYIVWDPASRIASDAALSRSQPRTRRMLPGWRGG